MSRRVLHVTEALGGGIITATLEMAAATPEFRHELMYCRRGDFDTGELTGERGFASAVELSGRRKLVVALADQLRRDPPDVLHLHSAWAGLLGRLVPFVARRRVIYSPHSFYFDRETAPAAVRFLVRMVERAFVLRTGQIVAVGPHEADEARGLRARTVLVPNVVRMHDLPPEARPGDQDPPRVVAVGRLADQKDPLFFLAVVEELRSRLGLDCQAVWVGSGDESMVTALEQAGITVTGWVPRREVLSHLRTCSVYVHTAAWEGNPMTVHEAAGCGAPVVARSIPSLTALGFPSGLVQPREVAARVRDVLAGGTDDGIVLRRLSAEAEQRRALTAAYRWAAAAR